MTAIGIHAHPTKKLGRRPPKNAPAIELGALLTGLTPIHPVAADHFTGATFGLYDNDKYGDCGPTSVANLVRLVSKALAEAETIPSQDDVFTLYRLSGNPTFDPTTDTDDNGVDMQTMLEALLEHGIGDGKGGIVKPLAFAKVNVLSDAEIDAAVSIFGGVLWGVSLMTAQQDQTNANPPRWDYKKSSEWGGHAVLNGKYDEATGDAEVISWDEDVQTTAAFRRNPDSSTDSPQQLEEAWVVVWQWNIDHPAFQDGVDLSALEIAYEQVTGKTLNVQPTPTPAPPTPTPTPTPTDDADSTLWAKVKEWSALHHVGPNRAAATAVTAWAEAKGFLNGEN